MGWGVSTLTEKIQLEEIYDLMYVPEDVQRFEGQTG
jgi:hypothetical protein